MITRFILKHHKGDIKGAVIECAVSDLFVIRDGLRLLACDPKTPNLDKLKAMHMLKMRYEKEEMYK